MDDFLTIENVVRNCNKVFIPLTNFKFDPNDVVFVAPHYIYYIHLYLGGIHYPNVTFVTVGFDYPMESTITKNSMNFILDHPHLKEWIVDNTIVEHPKLRKLSLIYNNPEYIVANAERLRIIEKKDDVFYRYDESKNGFERSAFLNTQYIDDLNLYYETMASYKYVYCANGTGLNSHRVAEAVALGCIPIVKTATTMANVYSNINFFCVPGLAMYYYSSKYEPVFQESPLILEKENVNNCIDLLKLPNDLRNYKMTYAEAREIINFMRKKVENVYVTFRVPPWNNETYYGVHCDNVAIKNKILNNL